MTLNQNTPLTASQATPSLATKTGHLLETHWLALFNTAWGLFVFLPFFGPVFMHFGWTWPGYAVYFIYNFFCHQLPERSWFVFGPEYSYTKQQIADAWGVPLDDIASELVRRQFIGTAEIGWKVAWSDRMVAMYGSIFLFGLLYALLRRMDWKIKGFGWLGFIIFIAPLGVDGTTHLINDVFRLSFRDTNTWAVILTGGIFPTNFYWGDLLGSLNSTLRIVSGILFGFGVVWFLWPIMDEEFGRSKE